MTAVPTERLLRALDEAAAKLEAMQAAKSEPIAVVGIGLRFPGGADSPETFWPLLRDGIDAVGDIPASRFDVDACYDPNPDAADKIYVRQGGFLSDCMGFDARFFGIAPREAASMDPQQRLLLEVAWEALENAGLAPASLAGSQTGVFVGITTNDYGGLLLRSSPSQIDAYYGTGNALNATPGRLAHTLGLQGPALAVDTACSSSLIAAHLACQSLRARECDLALACGVNLILAPEAMVALCRAKMLAADGRCKTFDAAADGYARGEGVGVVVLKRLSDAQAANNTVLALIRGSAANQDGATSGFTVPNGRAQEALIRKALENARVAAADIDYLEAHGTGTALGDPIEVQAAAQVFGQQRDRSQPLLLGSVKTNIGHLEAAAGIAGLIKTVLALKHQTIPKHLHFQTPNPHIPWQDLPLRVATETQDWPERPHPRLAAVSSFGASGTNAHLIVQEAPKAQPAAVNPVDRPLHLLALSAKTPAALGQLASRHAAYLRQNPQAAWADVCHSANTGRSHCEIRAVVTAADNVEAEAALLALSDGQAVQAAPKLAFLFTGQGSQYVGMGRQLYATQPTFRRALDRCAELLKGQLDRPLLELLYGPASGLLDDTVYTQPALFALEYALCELWRSFGVTPDAVLGHSVGEYAAACAASVFSLEEGLWLMAQRARLMGREPGTGGMAAVSADAARVAELVAPYAAELSIAALNGPAQTVVSGSLSALDKLLAACASQGLRVNRLNVSHAFHSPLTEPLLNEFAPIAGQIRYRAPEVAFISNLTGTLATHEVADARYWIRHAREPVRFQDGIESLLKRRCQVLLEIGPARTLLGMARACVDDETTVFLPSLRENADWQAMAHSLGRLYELGLDIDWRGFDRDYRRNRLALPSYPWQRQTYWAPKTEGVKPIDAKAALEKLTRSGQFSADELRLVPKLLEALAGASAETPLLYQIAWREHYLPGWPQGAATPQAVAAALNPKLAALDPAPEDVLYRQTLDELEALCVDYIAQAWRQLGWDFQAGESCEADALAQRLGVTAKHRLLLLRTAEILCEAGVLRRDGETFVTAKTPQTANPNVAGLLAQCPQAEAELTILDRCATRLAEALQGKLDPLSLLFPAGDVQSAASLYRDAPGARRLNRLVQDSLAETLQRLPSNRRLRVLEVGGGTGGTTGDLLAVLPAAQTDYCFTDISPRFTTAAQEAFKAWPFLRCQVLDIERDPESQGFAAQSFDVIVAANVLHATRDLAQTLAHLRRLAAPGALLLLLEGTAPIRFIDLIFGLTDGWWRFAGDPARPAHPLVSAGRWQALLLENGFSAESLAYPQEPWGAVSKQAVIVAQALLVPAAAKHWLILADEAGLGGELAARLAAQGDTVNVAHSGGDGLRLIQGIGGPFDVIDLRSLGQADAEDADTLEAQCENRLAAVADLVRACADSACQLWFVTQGAVAVGADESLSPGQAALWGLCRVLAREHPSLKPMRIDLDPALPAAAQAGALLDELRGDSAEAEIALRAGHRQAPRLVAFSPERSLPPLRLRDDASYLIVGGLGGLGLATARWIVAQGARHLALAGRNAETPQAAALRQELGLQGATVKTYQADVANTAQTAALLARIDAELPPLACVIHAAGVLDDGPLRQMDKARFARVLRPKLAGAWNLHRLTRHKTLDGFILFSSFTALLGSPGQANHAAANMFLDSLASLRRAEGLPALSINWGAWAEIGAAAQGQIGERLKLAGAKPLAPALGLRLLGEAWRAGSAQLAAIDMDWAKLADKLGATPLFAELVPAETKAAAPSTPILERLRTAPAHQRRGLLVDHIRAEVAAVLGLEHRDSIGPRQGFFQLGMDSLTSVELRNRLSAALGRKLPTTLAFDYPTPEALAGFLDSEPDAPPPADDAALLEGLSQQELEALLDAELLALDA